MQQVPAFHTANVWPIGSGDVFSAVFAQAWALEGASAVEAARRASLRNRLVLRLTVSSDGGDTRQVRSPSGDRWWRRAPASLSRGAILQHDAEMDDEAGQSCPLGRRHASVLAITRRGAWGRRGRRRQGPGGSRSIGGGLRFICDGLDSGTLFEIGYARKMNIPVVVFVQSETDESLKMLRGSGCEVIHDFATAVYRLRWMIHG